MTDHPNEPNAPLKLVGRCDPEFLRLTLCYLENELPPGDLLQLKHYLQASLRNREAFVRLSFTYTALVGELRSQSQLKKMERQNQSGDAVIMPALGDSDSSQHVPPPLVQMLDWNRSNANSINADQSNRIWRSRALLACGGLAAAVLIIALVVWRSTYSGRPPRAVLVQSIHARWLGIPKVAVGDTMPSGMIRLARGTVECRTQTGVTLIVQAPARLRIRGAQRIWLSSGRIVVQVPHAAVGFTVQTHHGSLIDLGTEFGVSQQAGKPTYAEVFQGHIAATRVGQTAKSAAPRIIGSNRAVNLSNNRIVSTPPTPFAFVRPREVAYWAKLRIAQNKSPSPADRGYFRWLAWSRDLSESPDLRAYYTFTPVPALPDELVNQAVLTRGKYNGTFGYQGVPDSNPLWVPGRWPSKSALKFSQTRRTAVALQAGPRFVPTHAISITVWIKPWDMVHTDHIINQVKPTDPRFNLCWLGTGETGFIPRAIYFDWGTGRVLSAPVLPVTSKWTFLTVTAVPNRSVRFYLDGKLVSVRPCPPAPRPHSMHLLIGAPGLVNSDTDKMFLKGQIDELAIFDRVLTAGEIASMYRAGRPAIN